LGGSGSFSVAAEVSGCALATELKAALGDGGAAGSLGFFFEQLASVALPHSNQMTAFVRP